MRGLTKRYGERTVVDHVDMQVPRGAIYGFLGPNGSGKTTTIRMLCGLLTPDEGEGTCLGFDLRTQAREIKRQVGYMTQKFGLYEDLSHRGKPRLHRAHLPGAATPRAGRCGARATWGWPSAARQLAGTLSGGWKQRLALAACLLHAPEAAAARRADRRRRPARAPRCSGTTCTNWPPAG